MSNQLLDFYVSEVHEAVLLNEQGRGIKLSLVEEIITSDSELMKLLKTHFPNARVTFQDPDYTIEMSAVNIPINRTVTKNPIKHQIYSLNFSSDPSCWIESNLLSTPAHNNSVRTTIGAGFGLWNADHQYLAGNVRFGFGPRIMFLGLPLDYQLGLTLKSVLISTTDGLPPETREYGVLFVRATSHHTLNRFPNRVLNVGLQLNLKNNLPKAINTPVVVVVGVGEKLD